MTFEPEAFQRCVELIENAPIRDDSRRCNPHMKKEFHCSETCLICNMDKNLFDLCLEHIVKDMINTMDGAWH